MIWWILPAAVGFFGVVVTLTGLGRIGKRKFGTGVARFLSGGLVVSGAGLISLVGLNLQTYSRLTHERPVAMIEIAGTGEAQHFTALVTLEGDEAPTSFDIYGDELRLEARILKWQPWANIIGYDSIYRLDRLSGRYTRISDEQNKTRSIYPVTTEPGVDVFSLVRQRGGWVKAVDAYYGDGKFVPMVDGAQYEVRMTQNGLIIRAANDVATRKLQGWRPPPPEAVDAPVRAGEED